MPMAERGGCGGCGGRGGPTRARVVGLAFGLVCALVCALAGCGTTVSGQAARTLDARSGGVGGPGPIAVVGGAGAASGGASSTGQGSTGGVGLPAQRDAAASASGGVGGAVDANGPGVTATTIAIGVAYFQNANAANSAIGGKGIQVSDPTATARAIVGDVNGHGGIGGRRVVPLFFSVDPQSATPYANEAQAECSYFAEDHKVLAVIDGTQAVGSLARPCLQQHGVAFITDNSVVVSSLTANEVDPDTIVWARLFATLVPSLARQGWFGGWDKTTGSAGVGRARTGIVTADQPALNRAVDQVLIPSLRREGYAPASDDVIRIAPPSGFSDDAATVAAIDNAALKLNADGVDHVILTDSNGSISLLFNNYAYSQHYLPRYGGSSGNFWQSLLAAGDIQPQTLAGAQGIGWSPVLDLPYSGGDGPLPNATRGHCLAVMRAAGQPPTSATVAASELVACDAFSLLRTALAGLATINEATLFDRVDGIGGAFQPGLSVADAFTSGQHDGIAAGYDFAFDSSCGCFAYHGTRQTFAAS
jgi:hypothetical protein